MGSSFIWMDFKIQDLSNGTKNTKFGVRTRKLCPRQFMVATIKVHGRDHNSKHEEDYDSTCSVVVTTTLHDRDHNLFQQ